MHHGFVKEVSDVFGLSEQNRARRLFSHFNAKKVVKLTKLFESKLFVQFQ